MPRPSYTVRSTHPRIWFTDSSGPNSVNGVLTPRAQNASGATVSAPGVSPAVSVAWKEWWDTRLLNYIGQSTAVARAPSASYANSAFAEKLMAYCLGHQLLGPGPGHADQAIGHARYAVQTLGVPSSVNDRRDRLLALCVVYDCVYGVMTSSDKSVIRTGIKDIVNVLSHSNNELMDGHTRLNEAVRVIAGLAIHGDDGAATTYINNGLDFWYGGNASLSFNGYAALDTDRHYSADGGAGKGPWYHMRATWGPMMLFEAMKNGFSTLTDADTGEAYDPWNEQFIQDMALYFLHFCIRGDGDYFTIGDQYRSSEPIFTHEMRKCAAGLASHGNWQDQMRWWYNQWEGRAVTAQQSGTSNSAYVRAFDFCAMNAAPQVAPVSTPTLSLTKLFNAPGLISHRNTWDVPNSSIINANFRQWYYLGHVDLDNAGGIQATWKNDMVLLHTGFYHTNDADGAENFGGSHNIKWKRLSISKSGVTLCDDGSANPHRNRDFDGLVSIPSGEGGLYHKYGVGGVNDVDPENVIDMQAEGGGLAWKCVDGRTTATGVEEIANDSSQAFFYAQCRRGYLRVYTDLGTSAERVRSCEHKLMFIKDQGTAPILFRVVRMESRLSSMAKQDHWHFWGTPEMSNFASAGYLSSVGLNLRGKCVISYYQHGNYNATVYGNGSSTAYGSAQFWYDPRDGSGGRNFPPTNFLNTNRHLPDLGRFRVAIKPKTQQTIDTFVCLIMPLAANGGLPSFTWLDDQFFYRVRFADGKVYGIAKTGVDYQSPASSVDITPPNAISDLTGSTPLSQTVRLLWTAIDDAVDPSMANGGKYEAWYRTT